MFTRCPACQTLFRVRPETLRIAHGQVRCGRCDTQFNALDTLAEDPVALAVAPVPESKPESKPEAAPPADDAALHVRPDRGDAEFVEAVTTRPSDTEAASETPAAVRAAEAAAPTLIAEPEIGSEATAAAEVVALVGAEPPAGGVTPPPGLTPAAIQAWLLHEESATAGRGRRWAWGLAAGVLLLALAGQWGYWQRAHLYEYPALRPAVQAVCVRLGCTLPLPRAPERVEVIERLVRAHPRVADALLVNVTFVSHAEGPIAYPVLELQLTDVSGNRAAARRFAPADYLPPGVDAERGLAPDQPQQVALELVAPQTDVVSFQFEFR